MIRARVFHRAAVFLLLFWSLLPLVPLLIWSFARGWRFPNLLPQEISLQAWRSAAQPSLGVVQALETTVLIAVVVTAVALAVGISAGRALGLHEFRGKGLVRILIAAPLIVPSFAVALGLHGVFIRLGLTGGIWGVVLVHLIPVLPYVILIMAGVFANFDPRFEQQARSLGASPAQVFCHVTLPAIAPGVMIAALFAFLISTSQYILTLMIGGGRVVTLPLVLYNFAASGRNDLAGAVGVIYVLPAILVLIITGRKITGNRI